jgi:hypothetical protein
MCGSRREEIIQKRHTATGNLNISANPSTWRMRFSTLASAPCKHDSMNRRRYSPLLFARLSLTQAFRRKICNFCHNRDWIIMNEMRNLIGIVKKVIQSLN